MIATLDTTNRRRRMGEVRTCIHCGSPFHPYRNDQVACKAQCFRRWWNAKRPRVGRQQGECVVCSVTFTKAKYNQVTCGDECRAKHRAEMQKARKEGAPVKRHITDAELDQRALADLDKLRAGDTSRPHRTAITEMQRWA